MPVLYRAWIVYPGTTGGATCSFMTVAMVYLIASNDPVKVFCPLVLSKFTPETRLSLPLTRCSKSGGRWAKQDNVRYPARSSFHLLWKHSRHTWPCTLCHIPSLHHLDFRFWQEQCPWSHTLKVYGQDYTLLGQTQTSTTVSLVPRRRKVRLVHIVCAYMSFSVKFGKLLRIIRAWLFYANSLLVGNRTSLQNMLSRLWLLVLEPCTELKLSVQMPTHWQ